MRIHEPFCACSRCERTLERGQVFRSRPSLELVVIAQRASVVWAQLIVAGELAGIPFAISRAKFDEIFYGPVRLAPALLEKGESHGRLQPEQPLTHGIAYR